MEKHLPKSTAGIILAGGMATRLGKNKQLVTLGGQRVIERVIEAAGASSLSQLYLVLGQDAEAVAEAVQDKINRFQITVIVNAEFKDGMSTSVKAGLRAAMHFPAAMFLLGDQPLIDCPFIDTLLEAFWHCDSLIVAPTLHGKRRNPVVFDQLFYGEILKITGDQGARTVITRHLDKIACVEFQNPKLFLDIDTRSDIEIAERLLLTKTSKGL